MSPPSFFHNMVNIGPLAAELCWRVWGTPANFNGFRISEALLQRRHSSEANQTLHDVWPLPGLVDYIYIFGGCCPLTEFCHVQNSLCALLLAALLHGIRAVGTSQTLRRWAQGASYIRQGDHHVGYWALAYILVNKVFRSVNTCLSCEDIAQQRCSMVRR